MKTVLVLGGSGMLGSMVTDWFERDPSLKVIASVRSIEMQKRFAARLPRVEWKILDVAQPDRNILARALEGVDWVINAVGMTKPYTHDDNPMEIERAVRINALLPYELGHSLSAVGGKLLQIATDCVYDGLKGNYSESDPHNALDVYGKTKSLGEALLPNVHCLRSSIIGPEPKVYAFLLEWFRRQSPNATVSGYTNHKWNGVTTLHFAKVCHAVIRENLALEHIQHLIPGSIITKANLLLAFARAYHRDDMIINPSEAKSVIDRTLTTVNETLNRQLWEAAGYDQPPTIERMVSECADYDYRLEKVMETP